MANKDTVGAQNGLVGDSFGTDIPETQVDEKQLVEEQKAAQFSKTAEFQKLKEHLENRINYYQQFLPDGREVVNKPANELGADWIVANTIIGEFKAVIGAYETAKRAIEEANKK